MGFRHLLYGDISFLFLTHYDDRDFTSPRWAYQRKFLEDWLQTISFGVSNMSRGGKKGSTEYHHHPVDI